MPSTEKIDLYEEPTSTILEERRVKARKNHRILYDCRRAKVVENGKVVCGQGTDFAGYPDGYDMRMVLSGRTPQVCQDCKAYGDE